MISMETPPVMVPKGLKSPKTSDNVIRRLVNVNHEMRAKRRELSYEECMEKDMTPAQRAVFLIVDEYWKMYGSAPSLRDIAHQRGKMGLGNTMRIVERLVKLGILKKVDGMHRSVRPVYINFKELE